MDMLILDVRDGGDPPVVAYTGWRAHRPAAEISHDQLR